MNEVLNILLAEDSADDVFLLRHAFQEAGVSGQFQAVCDGLECKAYLEGEGVYADRAAYPFPQILLLDLNMPRVNGFEVLEWVRQESKYKGLMVYVLTASARESDVRRAYELGANSYLIKPNGLNELIALIKALNQWHHFTVFPPD